MVGESNQNIFLIQKAASSFAEFEISEFEISRVDCIIILLYVRVHNYVVLNDALKAVKESRLSV